MWVCESYVVHHLVGTGLRCAPPTCVVHYGAQGGPTFVKCGGRPWSNVGVTRHFSFFGGSQGTCKKRTLFVHIWWGTKTYNGHFTGRYGVLRHFFQVGLQRTHHNIHRWNTRARTYNIVFLSFDNGNQGSQCSFSVPMYTLV